MPKTVDKETVAGALAGRLRSHYGSRLSHVLQLPSNPYEPEDDAGVVYVAAVIEETSGSYKEINDATRLAFQVDADFGGGTVSFVYLTSEKAYQEGEGRVAVAARREGRPL